MDEEYLERICACALNKMMGYEPKLAHGILQAFGNCRDIFSLGEKELAGVLGPYSRYIGGICRKSLDEAEAELARLESRGCRFIHIGLPCYPKSLADCPDSPLGLYIRSVDPPEKIFSSCTFSIVGTRDISLYGREWCKRIVGALGQNVSPGPAIVSGLAIGVDITAHLAALESGLPTIAVLPTGIDEVYPYRHRGAAERIAGTCGCALITDYPPGTAPVAVTFLRRNRIIAGLSPATLLVESKAKGGGMITARLAFDYGREVFAIPGRIDDIRSAGCNILIKEKIAEPVVQLDAFIKSLGFGTSGIHGRKHLDLRLSERYGNGCSKEKFENILKITALIRSNRGVTVEEISDRLGLQYPSVCSICGMLETDGFITVDLLQRCCIEPKFI